MPSTIADCFRTNGAIMSKRSTKTAAFLHRLNAHCEHMNSGLSAVAAVLALSVVITFMLRFPDMSYGGPEFFTSAQDSTALVDPPFYSMWLNN